jgi:predicted amidophosphoribosyltransferase
LAVPLGLDTCQALVTYDDDARALLTSLKNGGNRALVTSLADGLAGLVPAAPLVVTWAPTGRRRRHQRGFDQAELLARAVARRVRWRCVPLLERLAGPPQVGRTAGERRRHPGFRVAGSVPPAVLVIDDVATTGATLVAAARALRLGGALEVHGLVVARAR